MCKADWILINPVVDLIDTLNEAEATADILVVVEGCEGEPLA